MPKVHRKEHSKADFEHLELQALSFGITVVPEKDPLTFRCNSCKSQFEPELHENGDIPARCPKGCASEPEKKSKKEARPKKKKITKKGTAKKKAGNTKKPKKHTPITPPSHYYSDPKPGDLFDTKDTQLMAKFDRSCAKEMVRWVKNKRPVTMECQVCWRRYRPKHCSVTTSSGEEVGGLDFNCPDGCQINPATGDFWTAEGLSPRLRPKKRKEQARSEVHPNGDQIKPIQPTREPPLPAAIEDKIQNVTKVFERTVRETFRQIDVQLQELATDRHDYIPGIKTGVDPDSLMDERMAADFLGLTQATLAKKRKAGDGPKFAELSPKTIRYSRRSLVEWIRQKQKRS